MVLDLVLRDNQLNWQFTTGLLDLLPQSSGPFLQRGHLTALDLLSWPDSALHFFSLPLDMNLHFAAVFLLSFRRLSLIDALHLDLVAAIEGLAVRRLFQGNLPTTLDAH